MCIKRITIVFGLAAVVALSYIGYKDVVRTWHSVQSQQTKVKTLHAKSTELNKKIKTVVEAKREAQKKSEKLDQEKTVLDIERQKLKKELEAVEQSGV